jgi:hypothetical protein
MTANPTIARWISSDKLTGYALRADGRLEMITRDTIGDVWSPPHYVARIANCTDRFEALLADACKGII